MTDQQFDDHGTYTDFSDKNNSLGQDGTAGMLKAEREYLHHNSTKGNQGQSNGIIPAVSGMKPGDDGEVHGDANAVQQQADVGIEFPGKKDGKNEYPQYDAGADDV